MDATFAPCRWNPAAANQLVDISGNPLNTIDYLFKNTYSNLLKSMNHEKIRNLFANHFREAGNWKNDESWLKEAKNATELNKKLRGIGKLSKQRIKLDKACPVISGKTRQNISV